MEVINHSPFYIAGAEKTQVTAEDRVIGIADTDFVFRMRTKIWYQDSGGIDLKSNGRFVAAPLATVK